MNRPYHHEIINRYELFDTIADAVETGLVQTVVDTINYADGLVARRYSGTLGNLALHPEGLGIELSLENGTSEQVTSDSPARPLGELEKTRLISHHNPYFINYTAVGLELIGTKNDGGWCRTISLTQPANNPSQLTLPNLN